MKSQTWLMVRDQLKLVRNVVLSSAFPSPRWSSNWLYRLFAKTWFWFHGLTVSQKIMVRQYLKRPWSASSMKDHVLPVPLKTWIFYCLLVQKSWNFKTKFMHLYWKSNHICTQHLHYFETALLLWIPASPEIDKILENDVCIECL
jgi:hypothetical protein